MAALREYCSITYRSRAAWVLFPALVLSLVLHAVAGSLLFSLWRNATAEFPKTLMVTLEAVPPVMVESRPPVEVRHSNRAPVSDVPVPQPNHAPALDVIAVQRVEDAPPVAEIPAAPVVVAGPPPAIVNPPSRADKIEPPRFDISYLNNPKPVYPPLARKYGFEGTVMLRVRVSAKGAPEKILVNQTSGVPVLDEAALKAVWGWTFVPARRGDVPIADAVDVPLRFQLKRINDDIERKR